MRRAISRSFVIACAMLGGATSLPAGAQTGAGKSPALSLSLPQPNGKPADVKGVHELIDTFMAACLRAFPDDEAVVAKAKTEAYPPLSAEQLHLFLHDDPGRGWVVRRGDVVLALTVELPPFHSCAVRAMLPTEPDIAMLAARAVGTWGAGQNPAETLVAVPPKTVQGNGLVQEATQFPLLGPDKKMIEAVGTYVTRYPDKDVVEVRLVRMRGNNPR